MAIFNVQLLCFNRIVYMFFMVLCSEETVVMSVCVCACVCVFVYECDVWECGCVCLFVCDEDQRDGRTEPAFCCDDCLLFLRLTFR